MATMTKQEAGRLGGQSTVARYGSLYMAFIGRRGGRNFMASSLRAAAATTPYPVMAENYLEDAATWAVDTGTRVMVELWQECEPRPRRRSARTEDVKLVQWNRAASQW